MRVVAVAKSVPDASAGAQLNDAARLDRDLPNAEIGSDATSCDASPAPGD